MNEDVAMECDSFQRTAVADCMKWGEGVITKYN
jgi:hypothetical protein